VKFQSRELSRRLRFIICTALALTLTPILPIANAVAAAPTINGPTTLSIPNFMPGNQTDSQLVGYSVTGNGESSILVSISLTGGDGADHLNLTPSGSFTKSYGYESTNFDNFREISFTSTVANLKASLLSGFYFHSSGSSLNDVQLKINVVENLQGLAYYAVDDHYYRIGHFMDTVGGSPTYPKPDDGVI